SALAFRYHSNQPLESPASCCACSALSLSPPSTSSCHGQCDQSSRCLHAASCARISPSPFHLPSASACNERLRCIAKIWSGGRDLNPQPSPWKSETLPLSYPRPVLLQIFRTALNFAPSHLRLTRTATDKSLEPGTGIEPVT